jgi:hypothetical protein
MTWSSITLWTVKNGYADTTLYQVDWQEGKKANRRRKLVTSPGSPIENQTFTRTAVAA